MCEVAIDAVKPHILVLPASCQLCKPILQCTDARSSDIEVSVVTLLTYVDTNLQFSGGKKFKVLYNFKYDNAASQNST